MSKCVPIDLANFIYLAHRPKLLPMLTNCMIITALHSKLAPVLCTDAVQIVSQLRW